MLITIRKMSRRLRVVTAGAMLAFLSGSIVPSRVDAQDILSLPSPGTMVPLSQPFTPPLLKGIKVYPDDPFRFDFIVDAGDSGLVANQLNNESSKLIKYFLAALTIQDKDMWVNLSPYEQNRIIPDDFGKTEMGTDLLAQDYILKQLTASLIYPENELGKKFWKRVYAKAHNLYGTKDIPVRAFNKVWIVPDRAEIYENKDVAFVTNSHLKVMLEQDYVALEKNKSNIMPQHETYEIAGEEQTRTTDLIREIILPEIEKEVNEGKNFALLRQIYHSMILAVWYKEALKEGILARRYKNKEKILGLDALNEHMKEEVYQQYLEAFKQGVYNLIKEDYDPIQKQTIPRKYFSGGFEGTQLAKTIRRHVNIGEVRVEQGFLVEGRMQKLTFDGTRSHIGSHHRVRENRDAPEGSFTVEAEYDTWVVGSRDLGAPQVGTLQQAFDAYLRRHPESKKKIDPSRFQFEIVGGPRLGNTVHDRDGNPATIQIHRYALQQDTEGESFSVPVFTLAALEDEFAHFEIQVLLQERQIDNVVVEEALVILSRLLDELTDSLRTGDRRSPYDVDWLETTYSGEMANSLSEILSGIREMLAGGRMPNLFSLLGTLDTVVRDVVGFVTQSYTGKGYEEYGRIAQTYLEDAEQLAGDQKSVKDTFIQMFLERRAEIMGLVETRGEVEAMTETKEDPVRATDETSDTEEGLDVGEAEVSDKEDSPVGSIGEIEESGASLGSEVSQAEDQGRVLILQRGVFQTEDDVDGFLAYLESKNLLGLGKLIQAIKQHAEAAGRPLVGESEDSIIRFVEADNEASAFTFTEDYYSKTGFNYNIRIRKGTPLTRFIHELAHFASRDLLPEQYQSYLDSFPTMSLRLPFRQLYSAVYSRTVKEEALAIFMSYEFDQQLKEMGYESAEDSKELEAKEEISRDGINDLESRIRNVEPQATMFQINSILFAIEMILLEGGEPEANIGNVVFLEKETEGVRLSLDMNKVRELLSEEYTNLTGSNLIEDIVAIIGPQGIMLALDFLKGRNISPSQFYGIKEEFIRKIVDLIAQKIDSDRNIEVKQGAVIETDLGPRIVPEDRGGPRRITEQPEDSRNLIALFGTYAAYLDHLLRTKPDSLQQEHILNFIRTIDPERDVELLNTLLSKVKQDGHGHEKGDFELARALYEKGFKEKAREIFRSWGTSSYRWTTEAVAFLSENGETEILEPYLTSHREDLSVDRQYFGSEFTPLSFSLTNDEEARRSFDEEWAYIKDLLRVFIVASDGDEHYPDKFGQWWSRNKGKVSLAGQPFDVFSPIRAGKYHPGPLSDLYPDGRWMIHPIDFIRQALRDPRFRAKAIAIIGEFDGSPMKLKLYEQAAENLPDEWTVRQAQEFFKAWSKTLRAVGEDVVQHDFIEPTGDFQNWPVRFRDDEMKEDQRRMMPKSYAGSRLFHHTTKKMVETALKLARERQGFEEMEIVAQELVSRLEHKGGPSFNYRTWHEEYRWAEDVFFYSGNQYASQWAYLRFRGHTPDIKEFRKILKETSPPNRKNYNWEIFPSGSSDEIQATYFRDVKLYVENMKNMYAVALKFGFSEEAREIYESVRKVILEVAQEAEDRGYYKDREKNTVRGLQSYWALQEVLQDLLVRDGLNGEEEVFERLAQRIEQDTRGFFTVDSIADVAKELSQRGEYAPFAVRLFKITIDKLAPKRGEADWLSKEVREAVEKSSLSDEQKDDVYYYAFSQMWPEGEYPITRYLDMRDDASESEILIKEIFAHEDKYKKSKSFLLEKMARSVERMDPLKHGERIEGIHNTFQWELKILAFVAENFTDRKELLDPQNYKALKGLYATEGEALDALESLFPEQVKQDRSRGKHTALPSIAEVEKGHFDAQVLERQLTEFLTDNHPEAVWREAFGVLGAWLRYDVLAVINRRQEEEDKKKLSDKKEVFIDDTDLNDKGSYRLAWRLASGYLTVHQPSPFAQQAITTLFEAKTGKGATAKTFIAYRVLENSQATLIAKQLAFEMLAKSGYLPSYVEHVYKKRIKGKTEKQQREFFNDITLWGHMTPARERPDVLWAHFFEVEGEKRAKLRERIQHYRADEKNWTPDLRVEEDWWILQHELNKGHETVGVAQYRAAWAYQMFLKRMSLIDRVIYFTSYKYPANETHAINIKFLIDNWDRLKQANAAEALEIYRQLHPEDYQSWDLRDSQIAEEDFNKTKDLFVRFKDAMREGKEPRLNEVEKTPGNYYIFELLKIRNSLDPRGATDLKSLLRARFPSLEDGQIDELSNLAANPFQVEEDIRTEKGEAVGESKHWWSQYEYRYEGEKIWHKAIIAATGNKLSEEEQNALIVFMYLFSKTYYLNGFSRLNQVFPYAVPDKSVRYSEKCSVESARILLPQLAKYSPEELDEIAVNIPRYARIHLARKHQMKLSGVSLPENFSQYEDFVVFLIKTYLGVLKIGAVEQVNKETKGLDPDEALHRLFELRDMVKPGQLLASRPEVPDRYREIFKDFEDRVAPSDPDEVRSTIEKQLGWSPRDYKIVENLNAGSMGEVWRVRHSHYDFDLAIKVLTPSKEKKIRETLSEMEKLKETLDWYRDISVKAAIAFEIADRLIDLIQHELDFRNDYQNWKDLFGVGKVPMDSRDLTQEGVVPIPGSDLYVPMYFKATGKVLVMSYVNGMTGKSLENELQRSGQGKVVASKIWSYLQQEIIKGVYPIDVHMGNIMQTRKTGKIVLLDTGQVGRLNSDEERVGLAALLAVSSADQKPRVVVDLLKLVSHRSAASRLDEDGLLQKVEGILQKDGNIVDRMRDVFVNAPFYGLFVNSSYMDLLKGIMTFQGAALRMDPSFRLLSGGPMMNSPTSDDALVSQNENEQSKGGIDLNSKNIKLDRHGKKVYLVPLQPCLDQDRDGKCEKSEHLEDFGEESFDGLAPVILQIVPITNLPFILGAVDDNESIPELSKIQ